MGRVAGAAAPRPRSPRRVTTGPAVWPGILQLPAARGVSGHPDAAVAGAAAASGRVRPDQRVAVSRYLPACAYSAAPADDARPGRGARAAGSLAGPLPRAGVAGGRAAAEQLRGRGQRAGAGAAAGRADSDLREDAAPGPGAVLQPAAQR